MVFGNELLVALERVKREFDQFQELVAFEAQRQNAEQGGIPANVRLLESRTLSVGTTLEGIRKIVI